MREQTVVPGRGAVAPGERPRAIELVRDDSWAPLERRPWNSRVRLAAVALALAAVTFVHLSGISQPRGLLPTFAVAGRAEAIAVDRGLAYVARLGTVTAYRLTDGAVAWSRPLPGAGPALAALGANRLLLVAGPAVQMVDATSGAVSWIHGAGLVGRTGDVLVVTGGNAETRRLRGLSLATGATVWDATIPLWTTVARAAPDRPAPVVEVTEQAELTANGRLAVRDLATGRIRAEIALLPGVVPTDVSVAGGIVVLSTGAGTIHAYDAGDLRPLWQRPVPLLGIFSEFTACGPHLCHLNDRGTVALDRDSGETLWRAPVRYRALPVDEDHLFVSGLFQQYADSTGGVLDPGSGLLLHELAPWTALNPADGDALLVWRRDGQRRVIVGLFDAEAGRTHVVGRTAPGFGTPSCAAGGGYVLCTGDADVVAWPA
jgi:outer membrane protein assembly factor BamB